MILYLLFTFLFLGISCTSEASCPYSAESFQDQETNYSGIRCNEYMQVEFSRSICGTHFSKKMMEVSTENWCDLENIIKPYHELTLCLEQLSVLAGCYYPNSNIQDFFLVIHSHYFQNCTEELLLLEDAPHSLVITLTLISVSLIPILVYVVVWKKCDC
uniref:Uncharacterized protein n=1 Tax=Monopterus albus TaxID=43700 RepID=A0A3Q3K6X3_MONAL